jgi:hypothetical protein
MKILKIKKIIVLQAVAHTLPVHPVAAAEEHPREEEVATVLHPVAITLLEADTAVEGIILRFIIVIYRKKSFLTNIRPISSIL